MLSQHSLDAGFVSDLPIWNTPFDTSYFVSSQRRRNADDRLVNGKDEHADDKTDDCHHDRVDC